MGEEEVGEARKVVLEAVGELVTPTTRLLSPRMTWNSPLTPSYATLGGECCLQACWLRHHLPRPSNFRVREMDERDTIRDSCNAPEKVNKAKHFEVSIITLAYLST